MKTILELIEEDIEILKKENAEKDIIIKSLKKEIKEKISKRVKNNNISKKDMILIFKDIFKNNI